MRTETVHTGKDLMSVNAIFNPEGDDKILSTRTLWFGNTTNLMQLHNVRYQWANQLYEQMRNNFWVPQKTDMTADVVDYSNLTLPEQTAFDGILGYLTFLDSIQTCNLPHLKASVTAPEVSLCLTEQASQEGMHNQSYQYIIQSIIPVEKRAAIYEYWRTNPILQKRCKFIAGLYQGYIDDQSVSNYFKSLVANYLLEGIYFYVGFVFFYNLASRHLMPGCADIFRLINR